MVFTINRLELAFLSYDNMPKNKPIRLQWTKDMHGNIFIRIKEAN
jgi:hypothetical protein